MGHVGSQGMCYVASKFGRPGLLVFEKDVIAQRNSSFLQIFAFRDALVTALYDMYQKCSGKPQLEANVVYVLGAFAEALFVVGFFYFALLCRGS
jgi:hypothetical protein